ncbi:Dihydroxyacetone kinase 1 [Colletotrichum fructicola]|uniref:Dihydroxyacetone kinase n=1 Tax=Colletotrichum fructicola (strain Nara gc5) TaxID=1213859 RepID=L2FV73_COLFN|nr:Dihydroxyacetone kinase 1 [Colletotrichum fructicola]KAE9571601.1 Dihydroxyacetone kinase 1 [Colletotrichum fructicola]KAF4425945.1 Dihydroxyacetone kinase 1 [Colletotrichum fructicola]KAF4882896.1 Dihydroxyacetone kinase 1 [Colletotrichum fructicola]
MSSKHFSNDPSALVIAGLRSLTAINPSIAFDEAQKTVFLKAAVTDPKVAVISGGGSGHEPSFAGFVGKGLLSGAVAGSIFASPSADQVFRCLLRLGSQRRENGILVVIMNYTGDVLHFGMAVEKARAAGIRCDMLVVGDDVGVGRSRSGRVGRRGLAGTVIVQKIASALAAQGHDLSEVHKIASQVAENLVTVGASLSHVHVPGRAPSGDELSSNEEIEIGMGIHNEEGFGRVKDNLSGVISTMLNQLLDQKDTDRAFIRIQKEDKVVLMINNLGGLSQLELGAIANEVISQLREGHGIQPRRVLSGTYMSSLNGLGFSITLLKVVDESWVQLIDASTQASGWLPAITTADLPENQKAATSSQERDIVANEEPVRTNLRVDIAVTKSALTSALNHVIAAEPEVTKYDTLVGDGDCGLCLKTSAQAVLAYINEQKGLEADAGKLVDNIALVVEGNMDGTSGALYAIFLNALAHGLRVESQQMQQEQQATSEIWAKALQSALSALGKYTPAQPGDRTVVDALAPFVFTFAASSSLKDAVEAARKGCESTKGMEASLGRSVYVGGEEWKNCPDPGAYGLVKLLEGLVASP